MSNQPMEWDLDARGLKFAIVVSRFNAEITGKLLEGAQDALAQAGADKPVVFHVPGAFELALAVKIVAKQTRYDGFIVLGAVIRGDTPHFDYVAGEAARGLQQVSLELELPVAFGVLTTDTYDQAAARAGGSAGNK